jgi:sterol desaturase/sphingolipid hydroxylase (fatty acid hydroxylase superfamily)
VAVRQIEVPARLGRRLSPASFVLAGVTVFLLWVAVTGLLRQGSLGLVLSAGWAELAAPLLVVLVVVTGICERIWPAEPRPVLARGHVQDACFLALHAIVVIPLMTLLSVGAATLIGGHAQWIELWPAQNWSGWLLVPLTIVAMDAANWLAHYADHRFTALWRFHALHHSQEELSVLTSFRAHPLMHTTGFLLASIPVVVLMPARPIDPVLITAYVCVGTLQHANLRWTFGPLGRVLVSPAYHRLHHAADIQDANLGVVLTIWDVLAGWARFPSRANRVGRTGLDGRPVPVEQDDPAVPPLPAYGRPAHRALSGPALTSTERADYRQQQSRRLVRASLRGARDLRGERHRLCVDFGRAPLDLRQAQARGRRSHDGHRVRR